MIWNIWNKKSFERGPEKKIGTSYYGLIKKLLISFLIQFIILLIVQIVDIFVEIFNYDEENFIFYYLNFFFFGADLLSLIFMLILNCLFFSSLNDESKSSTDYAKNAYFSYIKINFTLFILWTILFLATAIPRVIIFLLNKEQFCFSITILIYLKIPFIISIYLHSIEIYVLYKETRVEELGHECGFY